jgi:small multidrug resistance family-3 protein
MLLLKTLSLFAITALAEITCYYLPYLWRKKAAPVWLLAPAAAQPTNCILGTYEMP